MILIEAGDRSPAGFEARLLLAGELASAGHAPVIDETTIPQDLTRVQKYEAAAYVAPVRPDAVTGIVVLTNGPMVPEALSTLKSYRLAAGTPVVVVGRFADHQAEVGAVAAVAYATGQEPEVLALNALQPQGMPGAALGPCLAAPATAAPRPVRVRPQVYLFLPAARLAEPALAAAMQALSYRPGFALQLVTVGPTPDGAPLSPPPGLAPLALADLPASAMTGALDIAVMAGDLPPDERLAQVAADVIAAEKPLIDCTADTGLLAAGAPALRGPADLGALAAYLEGTVLINRAEIGQFLRKSGWNAGHRIGLLQERLGLTPRTGAPAPRAPITLFLPTNGIGLGHAQRCCLIAEAAERNPPPVFAAFPSCVPLIQRHGFAATSLVQKSADHPEPFANDIVNHLRLSRLLAPGDRLVFDGGYVFQSIQRAILEKGLEAFWIRRGLWQPSAANERMLDKDRLFRSVIVPTEAFDELNLAPRFGSNVVPVGPIVQEARPGPAPDLVRGQIAARFGSDFDRLVVTMLGAGHAADRSAQLQALASLFERRPRTLHLVLVWPGALVPPGLYAWKNTRVVRSYNALALAGAADLVISAAGYNSYHEILYHRLPAIFVPQMSEFMDDQIRRAHAASDRGLAATVLADELMMLGREVAAMLDHGKAEDIRAALARASLPGRGNRAAADLIWGNDERA